MPAPKLPPDILRAIEEAADYVARRITNWQRPGAKIPLYGEETPVARGVRGAIDQLAAEAPATSRFRAPVGDSPAMGGSPAQAFDDIVGQRFGFTPSEEMLGTRKEAEQLGRGLYSRYGKAFETKLTRQGSEKNPRPGLSTVEPSDLAQEIITRVMSEAEARPQKALSRHEDKLRVTVPRFLSKAIDNVALPYRHVELARVERDLGKYRGFEPGSPQAEKALARLERVRAKTGGSTEGHVEPLSAGTEGMAQTPDKALQSQRLDQMMDTMRDMLAGEELTSRQKAILDYSFGLTQSPMKADDAAKILNMSRRMYFYDQKKALEKLHAKLGPMAERFGIEFEAPTSRDPVAEIKEILAKKGPERQGPPVRGAKEVIAPEDMELTRAQVALRRHLETLEQPTEGEFTKRYKKVTHPDRTPSLDPGPPPRDTWTPEQIFGKTRRIQEEGPEPTPGGELLKFPPKPGAKQTVTWYAPAQDISVAPRRVEGGLPITVRAQGPPTLREVAPGQYEPQYPQAPGRLTMGLPDKVTEAKVVPGEMRQVKYQEQVPVKSKTKAPSQADRPRTAAEPEESTERVFRIDPSTGERMEVVRHKNTDPATRKQRKYNWFRVTRLKDAEGKEVIVESPL